MHTLAFSQTNLVVFHDHPLATSFLMGCTHASARNSHLRTPPLIASDPTDPPALSRWRPCPGPALLHTPRVTCTPSSHTGCSFNNASAVSQTWPIAPPQAASAEFEVWTPAMDTLPSASRPAQSQPSHSLQSCMHTLQRALQPLANFPKQRSLRSPLPFLYFLSHRSRRSSAVALQPAPAPFLLPLHMHNTVVCRHNLCHRSQRQH